MDVVFNRECHFEIAVTGANGALVQPDGGALTFKVYENGTLMGYVPSQSNPSPGVFFAIVNPGVANGFEVGKSYSIFAIAVISGETYELPIARFDLKDAVTADGIATAVASRISAVRVTVTSPVSATGRELELFVGDAYDDDNGNPVTMSFTGLPDVAGKTCTLGVGPPDEEYVFRVAGEIVSSGGASQIVKFEITRAQTLLLVPDERYNFDFQVDYGTTPAKPRTVVSGVCLAKRKWSS